MVFSYVDFITKHNGAYLKNDAFEFFNQNVNKPSESSLFFDDITDMLSHVWVLSSQSTEFKNDPDPHRGYHYFPQKLVPFSSDGDCICFDYRNDPMEWPPIVMWHHEACEGDVNVSVKATEAALAQHKAALDKIAESSEIFPILADPEGYETELKELKANPGFATMVRLQEMRRARSEATSEMPSRSGSPESK